MSVEDGMAELLVMLPVGRVSLTLGVDFDGWRACAGMVLLIGVCFRSFCLRWKELLLLLWCFRGAVVFCLFAWLVGGLGDLSYLSVTLKKTNIWIGTQQFPISFSSSSNCPILVGCRTSCF